MTIDQLLAELEAMLAARRERKMSKYQADAEVARLQRAAYQAAEAESMAFDSYESGPISEGDYIAAMDSTAIACEMEIRAGATRRDLPMF